MRRTFRTYRVANTWYVELWITLTYDTGRTVERFSGVTALPTEAQANRLGAQWVNYEFAFGTNLPGSGYPS